MSPLQATWAETRPSALKAQPPWRSWGPTGARLGPASRACPTACQLVGRPNCHGSTRQTQTAPRAAKASRLHGSGTTAGGPPRSVSQLVRPCRRGPRANVLRCPACTASPRLRGPVCRWVETRAKSARLRRPSPQSAARLAGLVGWRAVGTRGGVAGRSAGWSGREGPNPRRRACRATTPGLAGRRGARHPASRLRPVTSCSNRLADEDLPLLGNRLQPLGRVNRIADSRAVELQIRADFPSITVPVLMPTDSGVRSALLGSQCRHGRLHRQGRAHDPLRIVLVRQRRPEQRHGAVADELVDAPCVLVDDAYQALKAAAEQCRDLFGFKPCGEGRQAAKVGEQHGHEPPTAGSWWPHRGRGMALPRSSTGTPGGDRCSSAALPILSPRRPLSPVQDGLRVVLLPAWWYGVLPGDDPRLRPTYEMLDGSAASHWSSAAAGWGLLDKERPSPGEAPSSSKGVA